MTVWRLRVDGTPAPKGSMRCIGARGKVKHQLIEDDKTGDRKAWRTKLSTAARALTDKLEDQGDAGVIVGVLALVERPPSAARRPLPTSRAAGDVDKHARMTLDALDDADVFRDDSRVCLVIAAKAYTDDGRTGAIVYVAPIGENPHRILTAILNAVPALTGTPSLV